MDASKRSFLRNSLYGAGLLGLRALASGIPASILANPRKAAAETPTCDTGSLPNAQYLILITSGSGDPLNANVPGCYNDPGIYHPGDATMTPTDMTFGGAKVKAAAPWANLGADILARTSFFHHGTYTNAHGDHPKVNRLMGAIQRQEMLVSLVAKNTAPSLCTVQTQPAVVANNLITYAGSVLPVLSPPNLQAVLAAPAGPLTKLQAMRDADVNSLNELFKSSGNTAQKKLLDQYASSQTQARNLSQTLLNDLSMIKGGGGNARTDQNIAAAVLLKMNVTPVVVMSYSFGGDNHGDTNLANEAAQTVASTAAITDLVTRLGSYGLGDKATIAIQNVFGRTLNVKSHSNNADGRNHNAGHHCTVMIGKGFKGSLIGGVELNNNGNDYRATAVDSATGAPGGDIPYEQTLASVGKTLGVACGVPQTVLDEQITTGKPVTAALA